MTIDVDRLITAAKAIESKSLIIKGRSSTFSRLAAKARKEGKLDPEDHLALETAKQISVSSFDDEINELIGALHSKPATWK